jgi:hypothetical protein
MRLRKREPEPICEDWVRFLKGSSPVLTASALAACEDARLVRQRPQAPAFFAAEKIGFVWQKDMAAGSYRFCFGAFLRRTPGSPPFSSMNWTRQGGSKPLPQRQKLGSFCKKRSVLIASALATSEVEHQVRPRFPR